jgi:hypothetical protein
MVEKVFPEALSTHWLLIRSFVARTATWASKAAVVVAIDSSSNLKLMKMPQEKECDNLEARS